MAFTLAKQVKFRILNLFNLIYVSIRVYAQLSKELILSYLTYFMADSLLILTND